jgi:hypothetical protein
VSPWDESSPHIPLPFSNHESAPKQKDMIDVDNQPGVVFQRKTTLSILPINKRCDAHVCFIGKLLLAKGLEKLLKLQACHKKANCIFWEMNIFGSCWQTRSNSRSKRLFGQSISSCHCL